jgi:hypothetical protein
MSDHQMDAARYAFIKQPKMVGYWLLPGSVEGAGTTMIGCYKKPRWLTIKLMDWLLEFKYKESL